MPCMTIWAIVTLLLSLLVALPAGVAQPPSKVARVGLLSAAAPRSTPHWVALDQRLRELGYVEGHTLETAFCNPEGRVERFPECTAELVRWQPHVIVAAGTEAALRAVQHATSTIPIVMIAVDYDPMALGYVAGLGRPGGNITGVFLQQIELTGKRLELLKEALPGGTRVAVLWDTFSAHQLREAEAAARGLGVQVQTLELRAPPDTVDRAFSAAEQGRAEALVVLASPVFMRERARLADLGLKHRLPTMFWRREMVEAGGLMAYGANIADMFRRAATYVHNILQGTKPSDLPVEQPTKFELVINLKTAQALGLTIPPTLLFQADEVIR
jgi:putative tryptophan/tyrosine transport system substrate-binding protein